MNCAALLTRVRIETSTNFWQNQSDFSQQRLTIFSQYRLNLPLRKLQRCMEFTGGLRQAKDNRALQPAQSLFAIEANIYLVD
ncbi:MAG: hypothetical protein ACNA8H_11810, partial [Anaerolineales bacterium]